MKKFYKYVFCACALFCVGAANAQVSLRPQLYGLVKARYELATENGDMRFGVRNTRLGVKGFAAQSIKYAMQMELNSLGEFSVLDSYAALVLGDFEVSLGQQPYKFSTELSRGAGGYFANRSFVGKYISGYHGIDQGGNNVVSSIGARDIGAIVQYKSRWAIPMTFNVGVLNGAGINENAWNRHLNAIGRLDIGHEHAGPRFSASYMGGKNALGDRMDMWGIELSYKNGPVIVESEFAKRYLDLGGDVDIMTAAVVNAMYFFRLPENIFAKTIVPQLRWDMGENIKFVNLRRAMDSFDTHRVTVGLCFGLTERVVQSEVRLNYEHYFLDGKPVDYSDNPLLQNKFTVEFFARF